MCKIRIRLGVGIWIIIICFLSVPTTAISQQNIDFLRAVTQYQNSVKVKNERLPIIDTTTFDINKYLKFFDKLQLPSGLKCRYVWLCQQFAGEPVLYVTADTFDLENYVQREYREYVRRDSIDTIRIAAKFSNQIKNEIILGGFAYKHDAKNYIIPQDSEAGYLQYLFFNQFGSQFALWWHASYGEKSVVFSKDELMRLYGWYKKNSSFTYNQKSFKKLLTLDPSPVIKLKKNSCLITWYEIMTHHGIYRRTYEIIRSIPFKITKKEDVQILKIDTNFIY